MFKVITSKLNKDKVWIRVSKKVSKKAVDRNKLRRQIKEIVRNYPKDLSKYIISVMPLAKVADFKTLKKNLLNKLKKI